MHDDTYSTRRACALADVSYRQADYWARVGLLRPTIEANGSGSRRRYTRRDVQCLRLVAGLRRAGASGEAIQAALDEVRDLHPDLWDGLLFVGVDSSGIPSARLGVAPDPRQVSLVVHLANLALPAPEPRPARSLSAAVA